MNSQRSSQENLQASLKQVQTLLKKNRMIEDWVHRQDMPRHDLVEELVHKQHLTELKKRLDSMHPADIAYILETLPTDDRLSIWELVKAEIDGDVLLEVSDAVRENLIENMAHEEIVAAAETLDADELADLAPDLPQNVVSEIIETLDHRERAQFQSVLSYNDEEVGSVMDFDLVQIRADVTLEVVLRYLRRFEALPSHTDKIFVVDEAGFLQGVLPLDVLLVNDPETLVEDLMMRETVFFRAEDNLSEAAQAFERYDLVSAPVVAQDGKLFARVTIEVMVDHIREEAEADMLSMAGFKEEEDLFAPVIHSVRNRWTWLAVNLVTAFLASRVIGAFEGTIEKLVALAALMPIVAGIGGNSGNQTITMIVRALALGQLQPANVLHLWRKELGVAMVNGLIWGGAIGVVAFLLYNNWQLGMVMTAAMTLNLMLAASMGVFIPWAMVKAGRDPALGSSVLITACTDSGGFFIFLALASVFLL